MLKSASKYYYTQLDSKSQRIYNEIYSAWKAYNFSPAFTMKPESQVDIQKIVSYISYDNPGLFYVDFRRITITLLGAKATVQANFLYDKSKITLLENQIENAVASLLSKHNFNGMDDYNKELVLHDFLVNSVTYASTANGETTSVVGALISKTAVCEGYTEAFKLLCDQVGMSCIVVSGRASPQNRLEEGHAWNIVKINDAYSHVDVTWDSTTKGNDEFCYDHLNLTDDDIVKDHSWDRALLPACTSSDYGYFIKNNLCVRDLAEFKRFFAKRISQGTNTVTIKILSPGITQEYIMRTIQDVMTIANRSYSVSLRYNQVRGTVSIAIT